MRNTKAWKAGWLTGQAILMSVLGPGKLMRTAVQMFTWGCSSLRMVEA